MCRREGTGLPCVWEHVLRDDHAQGAWGRSPPIRRKWMQEEGLMFNFLDTPHVGSNVTLPTSPLWYVEGALKWVAFSLWQRAAGWPRKEIRALSTKATVPPRWQSDVAELCHRKSYEVGRTYLLIWTEPLSMQSASRERSFRAKRELRPNAKSDLATFSVGTGWRPL